MASRFTQDRLTELEATHGRIAVVRGKRAQHADDKTPYPWEVIFRRPKRAEYKMYRANSIDPAQRAEAQETLCKQCVVEPTSREAFDTLLDEWPGICEAATDAITSLVGLAADDQGKG